MHFRVFSLGQGIEWRMGISWGLLKFKIFLEVLDISDIFGVNNRCWYQAFVSREIRVSPPGNKPVQLILERHNRKITQSQFKGYLWHLDELIAAKEKIYQVTTHT